MDAPGIREELRDMARRLGTVGYYVMLPNLYYRNGREGNYGYDLAKIRSDDAEREKKDKERSRDRKNQIGSGDRSERIRTYNFPQGRITDHRINMTLHKLEEFLNGDAFEELNQSLRLQDQEIKLANLKTQ